MDVLRDFAINTLPVRVLHHATVDEIHGARLTHMLRELGHPVSPGTLYPLLRRMVEANLLKSRVDVVGGRQIRLYRTTKAGRKTLAACRSALAELAADVG